MLSLFSCRTTYYKDFNMQSISRSAREYDSDINFQILPATLKVLQNQYPQAVQEKTLRLDAARGEGETAQILLINGGEAQEVFFEISKLQGPEDFSLPIDFAAVGYVPVKRPSLVGFKKRARFPDPLIPTNKARVEKHKSQSFYYTVYVPEEAPAGTYTGRLMIRLQNSTSLEIPVTVQVYEVTLPKSDFLKTWFAPPGSFEPPYYDETWSSEKVKALYKQLRKYRINTGFRLNMNGVFSKDAQGNVVTNWKDFDREVEEKLSYGIRNFDVYLDVPKDFLSEKNNAMREQKTEEYRLFYRHLLEKNWTEYFYWYCFDEPRDSQIKNITAILDWGHEIAPKIKNLIPLGFSTKSGMRKFVSHLDTWCPHIHQYDKTFFSERQAAGDEVWIYTCVQNAYKSFPDNWKIDTNGTSHRALGTWLYKHNIDGYLYWATGYWSRNNPWKDTETFIFGNGDGSMLYPALDKKSDPYPSIRLHITRDAIEDFDLLKMLEAKYGKNTENTEVKNILSCKSLIYDMKKFSNNDYDYINVHKRILELLSAQ